MSTLPRILLVFLDGVGLAEASPSNPLARGHMPALERLLGGPLTREQAQGGSELCLVPLDACLDVPGLPQSATGQTTLFTGLNAAAALGRHVTAFPGPRLRQILEEHSLFRRAARAGRSATFANAFSPLYFELVAQRRLRYSATVCAVLAAGLPLRGLEHLRAGEAVSWDVVRDRLRRHEHEALAQVTAEEAGRHLAALAAQHQLTVFETFLTDLAGHGRGEITVAEALARIDGLLAGALAHLPPDCTLVLTSDHGNVEDDSHTRHTRNPVPLLALGPQAPSFVDLGSLRDVTPRILACLGQSGQQHAAVAINSRS